MKDHRARAESTNRRTFLRATTAASTFTIVPRHVLGGAGFVAPSEQITLAYIGTGTQGLRELPALLERPEIRVVAVCDPNKNAVGYRDWSQGGLLAGLRQSLGQPGWRAGTEAVIPGGREAGRTFVDAWYSRDKSATPAQGCAAYSDVRQLLEAEKDLDAIKIMTPDHLHGVIAIAAMKRGKHVLTHKPISNRLLEGRKVVDTAKAKPVATLLLAWDANRPLDQVLAWINAGEIGTLREIHNWSNRPVWPQFPGAPTETPPVPEGFEWDLWLGPEAERPYHPDCTHMVFRGWYDFGGGSMADMGHYSLWSVFNAFGLSGPTTVEPVFSHQCAFRGDVATTLRNDQTFPLACRVRFRYPARGPWPALDLYWHDGGFKPPAPEALDAAGQALEPEGMMFVGDRGQILAGFHGNEPRLLRGPGSAGAPATAPDAAGRKPRGEGLRQWVEAVHGGPQPDGAFPNAWPLTEAVNLYAAALRAGRTLRYDAENLRITNIPEANRFLARSYRKGWDPESI